VSLDTGHGYATLITIPCAAARHCELNRHVASFTRSTEIRAPGTAIRVGFRPSAPHFVNATLQPQTHPLKAVAPRHFHHALLDQPPRPCTVITVGLLESPERHDLTFAGNGQMARDKAVRVGIAEDGVQLAAVWRFWPHGSDVYAASRNVAHSTT